MTLFGYDIASAYPYAMAQLPCLRPEHGRWKHYKDLGRKPKLDELPAVTLVSWVLKAAKADIPWGPLPFRHPDGTIVFPVKSEGGWAWQPEIREAYFMHPGLRLHEAWSWERKCVCPPPFRDEVVRLFLRRLAMGKNSRGLTVKLALNSAYGVSAQSAGGGGRFRCMVRAGLITSMTRAMLLQAVQLAPNPWDVLELATDSVLSRVPLKLPAPIAFGTEAAAATAGKGALGSWEGKCYRKGVFLMRPGLRFELGRKTEEARTAARGVGVRVLHQNREKVLRAWLREPMAPVYVQQPPQFHASKGTIRAVQSEMTLAGGEHWQEYRRDDVYGTWSTPKPRKMGYEPGPKRESIAETEERDVIRLLPWAEVQGRSAAYSKGIDEATQAVRASERQCFDPEFADSED